MTAGTVVVAGRLVVRASRTGYETQLAQLIALVDRAQAGKSAAQRPALAAADLGLALGSGTDVAISAADLLLLRDDLSVVPDAIRLARATLAVIRRNLAWAFGYNIAAIPLAAAGYLNPADRRGSDGASSAFVVANSVRLRRFAGTAPAVGDRRPAGPRSGPVLPAEAELIEEVA